MLRHRSAVSELPPPRHRGRAHKQHDITLLDSRDSRESRYQQLCAAERERRWAAGENICHEIVVTLTAAAAWHMTHDTTIPSSWHIVIITPQPRARINRPRAQIIGVVWHIMLGLDIYYLTTPVTFHIIRLGRSMTYNILPSITIFSKHPFWYLQEWIMPFYMFWSCFLHHNVNIYRHEQPPPYHVSSSQSSARCLRDISDDGESQTAPLLHLDQSAVRWHVCVTTRAVNDTSQNFTMLLVENF